MIKRFCVHWGSLPLLFATLLFWAACTDPEDDSDPTERIDFNGHDYVDLALPSGLLWATCNVGAESPEEYGDYFAWGETEPKSDYSLDTYKYCNDTEGYSFSKYVTDSEYGDYGKIDNKTALESSDDAATANWGGSWRMPTYEEWQELCETCKWTWTSHCDVDGYKVTSVRNGNSIFLPAAGCRNDTGINNAGSNGEYWSSSVHEPFPDNAWFLHFTSRNQFAFYYYAPLYSYRYHGRSIRPVCVP